MSRKIHQIRKANQIRRSYKNDQYFRDCLLRDMKV